MTTTADFVMLKVGCAHDAKTVLTFSTAFALLMLPTALQQACLPSAATETALMDEPAKQSEIRASTIASRRADLRKRLEAAMLR